MAALNQQLTLVYPIYNNMATTYPSTRASIACTIVLCVISNPTSKVYTASDPALYKKVQSARNAIYSSTTGRKNSRKRSANTLDMSESAYLVPALRVMPTYTQCRVRNKHHHTQSCTRLPGSCHRAHAEKVRRSRSTKSLARPPTSHTATLQDRLRARRDKCTAHAAAPVSHRQQGRRDSGGTCTSCSPRRVRNSAIELKL